MLMDYEEKRHPQGFEDTKEIHKIQGFQDLTNRLQASLNAKYEASLASLNQQIHALQIKDEARAKQLAEQQKQIDFLLSRVGETNKEVLVTLEQRIDVTDSMLAHLKAHEAEQDRRLDGLEATTGHVRRKMGEVESEHAAIKVRNLF